MYTLSEIQRHLMAKMAAQLLPHKLLQQNFVCLTHIYLGRVVFVRQRERIFSSPFSSCFIHFGIDSDWPGCVLKHWLAHIVHAVDTAFLSNICIALNSILNLVLSARLLAFNSSLPFFSSASTPTGGTKKLPLVVLCMVPGSGPSIPTRRHHKSVVLLPAAILVVTQQQRVAGSRQKQKHTQVDAPRQRRP